MDTPIIEEWLTEKGMEHDKERYLLEILFQKLYQDRIIRPSLSTLEIIIGTAQELLIKETYNRLSFLWTDDLFNKLDSILETDPEKKITPHRWLSNVPSGNSVRDINLMLEKYEFLIGIGGVSSPLALYLSK